MPPLILPVASHEDVTRHRHDFEFASKHGQETRDALIRLIWTQVHSTEKSHNREGVKAADQLLQLEAEEEQQLMYLAAVGTYNQGRMVDTRKRLKAVLAKYPNFGQAKALLDAVDDRLTSDTLLAGGALAAVGGLAALVVGGILASASGR